ncbi:hypothetical protein [Streptomyces sp. NPDC056061]|uniref:hypothetical protein n=1 Tax=Streptomyces sp. NPDC056061 TaxID=3345700 RepID=UPI0035D80046
MCPSVQSAPAGNPGTLCATVKASLGSSRVWPAILDIIREQGLLTHDQLIGAYP